MWRFFNDPSKHKFDWEHGLHGVDRLVSHFQIWNWKIFHLFVDSQRTFIHIYILTDNWREIQRDSKNWMLSLTVQTGYKISNYCRNKNSKLCSLKCIYFFCKAYITFITRWTTKKKINRRLRFANALYRDFVSKEEKSVVCAGLHKSSPQLSLQVVTSYIIYCRFVIRSQATPLPYQPI